SRRCSPTRPPPTSPLFPYTPLFRSLAQRLAERADTELGGAVHGGHGERAAAGERADVDDVGDPSRFIGGCLDQMWDGCVGAVQRSEEHTSELQSRSDLVCRLRLEKK